MTNRFTGNKDVDKVILSKLDDQDLGRVCSSNKYLRKICRDELFWKNRTIKRFGSYLGDIKHISRYKKRYSNSWRNYYISLINFLEEIYNGREYKDVEIDRKDFKKINRSNNEISDKYLYIYWDYIQNLNSDEVFLNSLPEFDLSKERLFIFLQELLQKNSFFSPGFLTFNLSRIKKRLMT